MRILPSLPAAVRRLPIPLLLAGVAVAGCGTEAVRTAAPTDSKPEATATATPTATPMPSFSDLVDDVRSGVVRIETERCDGEGVGTGLLIAPNLVLTVEHVVDGAVTVRLKPEDAEPVTGVVIGQDAERDVALLRTSQPIEGHVFELDAGDVRLGDGVAALGYPLGLPLTVTRGLVSGTGRDVPINGTVRRELIQTDAAINPGNSGGPLMRTDTGEVVGLVDLVGTDSNGVAYAVSAKAAASLADAWAEAPQPVAYATCADPDVPEPSSLPANEQPPGIATYKGRDFAIDHPISWDVTAREQKVSYGTDTRIESPSRRAMIQVDVTPGVTDLRAFADPVIAALRRDPTYEEVAVLRTRARGHRTVIWEFTVVEDGVRVRKQDEFFIDGAGRGVAILTQAPDRRYVSMIPVFDGARGSFVER